MVIQIFKPLESEGQTFASNKLGDTAKATFFEYRERFYGVGDFTLNIPIGTVFADKIKMNTLLFVDYKFWVIIKNIVAELTDQGYMYKITGTDLKGLLNDRITLYGKEQDTGTQGYDVVKGSSETVIKHYINNNMVNPADANRKIIGLSIAEDKHRGIAEDTYMSRFEPLSDLVKKVSKNAKIGYCIYTDISSNQMIFDVIEPVNKTQHQSVRNRVVFSVNRRNVASITYEKGITNSKNAIYATKSGGTLETDALTQLVLHPDEVVPKGIHRREIHINVSINSLPGEELDDINSAALKQAEDYKEVDSFECPVSNTEEYGKIYYIGDYVTVESEMLGVTVDTQITEVKTTYDQYGKSVSLTFGEKKPKPINQVITKMINIAV